MSPCVRKHRGKAMLEAAVRHYETGRLRRKVLAAWRLAAAAQLRGKASGWAQRERGNRRTVHCVTEHPHSAPTSAPTN